MEAQAGIELEDRTGSMSLLDLASSRIHKNSPFARSEHNFDPSLFVRFRAAYRELREFTLLFPNHVEFNDPIINVLISLANITFPG